MGTPAHAIRDNDCLNTTGGRSFVVNGMFEEPGALEKYEASQADNDYIMAPCHVSSGAVAPHRDSVLIAVDGACRGNGQLDAMAAYAVFFAPSSRFNRSAILPTENATSTSQRAELSGGIAALEEAKQLTRPGLFMPRGQVPDMKQVVIKTDSEYLCFGATEWIAKWKKNGWKNARGRPVANRGLFQKLDGAVRALEEMNILVQFWHVPRKQNCEADALVNERLDKREQAVSHTRTQRRRNILILLFEEEDTFCSMYKDFLQDLEDHAEVRRGNSIMRALEYLGSNTPDAIIVADSYVAREINEFTVDLMVRMEEYVSAGGTAVFGCMFSSFMPMPDYGPFFNTHFGFPWETGSYERLTAKVNTPVHEKLPRESALVTVSSQKALCLKNVEAGHRLYEIVDGRPSQRKETPIAWAKVGKGWLGVSGDVNNEQVSQRAILAMCNLSF